MKGIIRKLKDGMLLLELNKNVYELEAIFQAVYRFTDTCYIYTEPISDDIMGVYFKPKDNSTFLICKYMDNNCGCKSDVSNVNRLLLNAKTICKDLDIDLKSVLRLKG